MMHTLPLPIRVAGSRFSDNRRLLLPPSQPHHTYRTSRLSDHFNFKPRVSLSNPSRPSAAFLHCRLNCLHHHHDGHVHHHHEEHHNHHHGHHSHSHGHNPSHGHAHSQGGSSEELSKLQKVFLSFAQFVGWTSLADYLRENLQLCCFAGFLFITASAFPYFVHRPVAKVIQNCLMAVAFPLVGVSSLLDALTDIFGGRVNIHVLMAMAAFASVFMGNILEGGLLLAMFNIAHIGRILNLLLLKLEVIE